MRTLCQELIKANKTTTSDAAFDKKCKNKFYILQTRISRPVAIMSPALHMQLVCITCIDGFSSRENKGTFILGPGRAGIPCEMDK